MCFNTLGQLPVFLPVRIFVGAILSHGVGSLQLNVFSRLLKFSFDFHYLVKKIFFLSKNTFNNSGEKHIILIMSLPVIFVHPIGVLGLVLSKK